ncbi:MAG: hypothetical protein K1X88_02035 [Nannocystaceae bacterium]|nr:hypothetical protein [Nannocystaceae bacterium]
MRCTWIIALGCCCACGAAVGPVAEQTGSSTTADATSSTSAGASGNGTTIGTSVGSSSSTSGESTASSDSGVFVPGFDQGGDVDCSLWQQDCPRGQKCMPWANDGGNSWNSTRCTPIAPDPHDVGEPCTVEGSGVSGIDDCRLGAMCFDVDPDTLMGTCVALCTGSPNDPQCAGTCEFCTISDEGSLTVCLPTCDPLAPSCDDDEVCVAIDDGFQCAPIPNLTAGLGEPCEFPNQCTAGLQCIAADVVGGCGDGISCCSPVCDTAAGFDCDAVLPGTVCVPWYAQPPSDGCVTPTLGVCALPG